MAKRGHFTQIDKDQFEKLCGLQCTEEEIAAFFDCNRHALNDWCKRTYNATFKEIAGIKRCVGKINLRRNQFNLSKKNAAMAIWLGKNYLGQRDNFAEEQKEQRVEDLGAVIDKAGLLDKLEDLSDSSEE